MKRHPRRLMEAGISEARYAELQDICRQYPEYKQRIALARAGVTDHRGGGGAWHKPDPTGNAAIRAADMPEARRVGIIERAAASVAEPNTAAAIIESAAKGKRYEKLKPRPPCGINQFYVCRQLFFIELDRRLWDEG